MRKLITLMLIACTLSGMAQTKQIILSEKKIRQLTCNYVMLVNMDKGDTMKYVWIGFQNSKYSHIIDIASVSFPFPFAVDDFNEFKKDLKSAMGELGKKQFISWDKKLYRLQATESFSNLILLKEAEKEGDGYTWISIGMTEKLLLWLESIQIVNK